MTRLIPILLYHSIEDREVSPRYRPFTVSSAQFAAQIDYLGEAGFQPLTVSEMVRRLRSGTLPERPVVVTFDDGLADFHTGAWPILLERCCPATLYVTTGVVGGRSRWLTAVGEGERPMLSWSQIREIQASGIECGAHSETHPELDVLSAHRLGEEIEGSKRRLEDELGRSVKSFAYPHGYHDRRVRQMVVDAGFESACAVKYAMSSTADDPFALARLAVGPDLDLDGFAAKLRGEGVAMPPRRERVRTMAWRLVRRTRARLRASASGRVDA